jgi:hypothetical protein
MNAAAVNVIADETIFLPALLQVTLITLLLFIGR